jgi:hypothetical protein
MLLDGSHRAVAHFLPDVPFVVDLFIVSGPIEPDCLADLLVS